MEFYVRQRNYRTMISFVIFPAYISQLNFTPHSTDVCIRSALKYLTIRATHLAGEYLNGISLTAAPKSTAILCRWISESEQPKVGEIPSKSGPQSWCDNHSQEQRFPDTVEIGCKVGRRALIPGETGILLAAGPYGVCRVHFSSAARGNN